MQSSDLLHLATVLVDEAFAPLTKVLNRFRCPPVLQIALLVVLTPFIIKTVRQFVA